MAGAEAVATPNPKVLVQTDSTPMDQQGGHPVPVEMVKLVPYWINIRSFHPNKKFEPLGLRFHGDNRGFSLEKSFQPAYPPSRSGKVTSRIWQRYSMDLARGSQQAFQSGLTDSLAEESNRSSGPELFSDGPEDYIDRRFKPHGTVKANAFTQDHAGEEVADITSSYAGKNFAFRGSRFTYKETGKAVVPDLDVFFHLWIKVERVRRWMDITFLVDGDGFPDCEAFIEDPAGNKVFLGTYVRIGTPGTHLFGENHRIMFANVLRVELTPDGNFGSKLWIFTQVQGATRDRRDDYPATGDVTLPPGSQTSRLSDMSTSDWSGVAGDPPPVILPGMDTVAWPADPLTKIGDGVSGGFRNPVYISAYEKVDAVWQRLQGSYKLPPVTRDTTVQTWNDYHLHRNPNEGRGPDDEDLDPSLWKK